jgi:predicted  nucleic acid-binding Zn-ribbon protein
MPNGIESKDIHLTSGEATADSISNILDPFNQTQIPTSYAVGNYLVPLDDIEELRTDVATISGDLDALEVRVDIHDVTIATNEADIDNLQVDVATISGDLIILDNRVTVTEGDIDSLEINVSNLDTQVATISGDLITVDARLTVSESDIDTLETNVDTISGDVITLDGRVTVNEADIDNLQADVIALETITDDHETRITGNTIVIGLHSNQIATLETDVNSLEIRMQSAEDDIIDLRSDVDQNTSNISYLWGEVQLINDDIDDLQATDADHENRITFNEFEIDNLQSDVITISGDFNTLDGRVTFNELEIDNLQVDVATISGDVITLDNRVTVNEADIDNLQVDVATISGDVITLDSRVTVNEADIDNLEVDVATISGDVETVGTYAKLSISTGIIYGGEVFDITPSGLKIAAGSGYIVNHTTNPNDPTINYVEWTEKQVSTASLSISGSGISTIAIDVNGDLYEKPAALFDAYEHRDYIAITRLNINDLGQIASSTPYKFPVYDFDKNVQEYIEFVGPIVNGNVISCIDSTMNISRSAGSIIMPHVNYDADKKSPNKVITDTESPLNFAYGYYNGVDRYVSTSVTSIINANNYDDVSGVLAVTPNNKVTTQRAYIFPDGSVFILYGQKVYANIDEAKSDIGNDRINLPTDVATGRLLAYIIVKQGATNLCDPFDATLITAPNIVGSGGTAGVIQVDTTYPIVNLGSLSIPNIALDQTYVDGISGELIALDNRVTVNEADIDNLEVDVATISGDVITLDGRVTVNEADIDALESLVENISGGPSLNVFKELELPIHSAIVPFDDGAELSRVENNGYIVDVLNYDSITQETASWSFAMPSSFSGLTNPFVELFVTSATAGTARINAALTRINTSTGVIPGTDLINTSTNLTINTSDEIISYQTIPFGATQFSVGDKVLLKIYRDVANPSDTLADDLGLVKLVIKWE